MPRERALSEADKDNSREDKHMEDLREESRTHAKSFVQKNSETVNEVSDQLAKLDIQTFHSESLESCQATYHSDAFIVESDLQNKELKDLVKEVIEEINKKSSPTDKKSNNRRYLAYFFGLLGIGGTIALIYEICARKAKDEPTDDIDLSQADKDKLEALFQKWRDQPDDNFWETVAKYQETSPTPTIADQIYFCQYTKQLSTSSDVWVWDKGADETAIVFALEKLYNDSSPPSTAVMYRNITQQTYQGKKLPRDIAADVLTLALGQILKAMPS